MKAHDLSNTSGPELPSIQVASHVLSLTEWGEEGDSDAQAAAIAATAAAPSVLQSLYLRTNIEKLNLDLQEHGGKC